MTGAKENNSAILYQNASKTITLIDIPKSIAVAQELTRDHGGEPIQDFQEPYSVAPPEAPYPSTEPKSAKGEVSLQLLDEIFLIDYFKEALTTVAAEMGSKMWYLERKLWDTEALAMKTSRDQRLLKDVDMSKAWSAEDPLILAIEGDRPVNVAQINNRLIRNKYHICVELRLDPFETKYCIPPSSDFLLSRITLATAMSFSMAALQKYPNASTTTFAGPGEFDVIILDPPWSNRSVRRSRQYQTMEPEDSPLDTLSSILGQHIAPGALIACWITNKPAVRERALDLLAGWNLDLVEEWVWLKVTTKGEPVTDIEGVWRKPYELLLLGRKPSEDGSICVEKSRPHNSVRRIIVGVPSLHSQKPHLGELVEQLLTGKMTDYRVLEIFARNLTAGWWAWGDEVIKFNDAMAWSQP